MTKGEFYRDFIRIQKESGQGLSGIVKLKSSEIGNWLDEFIEEGLVKACDTGGSIGHPESNIFYMPTSGYNVWEDDGDDGEIMRHKGRYLHYVRLYLGAMDLKSDISIDPNQKWINPSILDYLGDPIQMKEYTKWLTRNKSELEIMKNLDDFYSDPVITFSKEELEWIKDKSWYENNKTIELVLADSTPVFNIDEQVISLNNRLLSLYDMIKHSKEIESCKKEIKLSEKYILYRKKLHKYISNMDKNLKIQEVI